MWLHAFLISEVGTSHSTLPCRKCPCTSWIWGWMTPRADLNAVEKRKVSCLCCALNSDFSGVSHGLVTVQVYNLIVWASSVIFRCRCSPLHEYDTPVQCQQAVGCGGNVLEQIWDIQLSQFAQPILYRSPHFLDTSLLVSCCWQYCWGQVLQTD
jgi:hypothetical protein